MASAIDQPSLIRGVAFSKLRRNHVPGQRALCRSRATPPDHLSLGACQQPFPRPLLSPGGSLTYSSPSSLHEDLNRTSNYKGGSARLGSVLLKPLSRLLYFLLTLHLHPPKITKKSLYQTFCPLHPPSPVENSSRKNHKAPSILYIELLAFTTMRQFIEQLLSSEQKSRLEAFVIYPLVPGLNLPKRPFFSLPILVLLALDSSDFLWGRGRGGGTGPPSVSSDLTIRRGLDMVVIEYRRTARGERRTSRSFVMIFCFVFFFDDA
ncbi:hypothetical protein KCU90_g37, partial [Aureobasidium melanogenum]